MEEENRKGKKVELLTLKKSFSKPLLLFGNVNMRVVDSCTYQVKPRFTLEVRANVQTQIQHSYWCKKLKSAPKGLTLGVKAEREKKRFNAPPNAGLYAQE